MLRSFRAVLQRRGFTLVEVAIATAIVAVLTGVVVVIMSQNANDAAGDITDVDTRAGEAQAAADAARAILPSGGGGGGGGGAEPAAFQPVNLPAGWNTTWVFNEIVFSPSYSETPSTSYCGGYLTFAPMPDSDMDSQTLASAWSFSVDGGAFQTWLPSWGGDIFGGASPGVVLMPGLPGTDWDIGQPGLCNLVNGQQVQFQTPSGYFSPVLTINK